MFSPRYTGRHLDLNLNPLSSLTLFAQFYSLQLENNQNTRHTCSLLQHGSDAYSPWIALIRSTKLSSQINCHEFSKMQGLTGDANVVSESLKMSHAVARVIEVHQQLERKIMDAQLRHALTRNTLQQQIDCLMPNSYSTPAGWSPTMIKFFFLFNL